MAFNTTTKNTFILLGQTYIVVLIGLVIGILSARGLSVSDRGTLALILLGTQLCSRLGNLGIEQSLHKFGTEKIKITHFYLSGAMGVILASPVLWLIVRPIDTGGKMLLALVICSFFIHILRVNTAILIFEGRITNLARLNIGQSVVQLALYVFAFYRGGLYSFMIAWMLNVCLFSFISTRFLNMQGQGLFGPPPKFSELIRIQRRGWKFNTVAIPEIALTFCLELPVIRSVLGGAQAGLYAISNTITSIYYQIFVAISAVAASNKRGSIDKRSIYAALGVVCLILMLTAPLVIKAAFGENYVGAERFVLIMLPVAFVLGWSRIEQMTLRTSVKGSTQIVLVALLLTSILISGLIGNFATVYAIALAYFLYAIALVTVIRRSKNTGRVMKWARHD